MTYQPVKQAHFLVVTPIIVFLIACFLWSINLVYARDNNIRFKRISIEQGLFQGTIRSIHQDKEGYIWFGGDGGLNKYDGYTFTVYQKRPDDSTYLNINCICESETGKQAGMLWLGTDNGLECFDPGKITFTHFRNNPENPNSLSNNDIWCLYQDRTGTLWIGTSHGLNKFVPGTGNFTRYFSIPGNTMYKNNLVMDICEDGTGMLWLGTGFGLYRFDPVNEDFHHISNEPGDVIGPGTDIIWDIHKDVFDFLWMGTYKGLFKMDPQKETFCHYGFDDISFANNNEKSITCLLETREGEIWLGTGGGLLRFDPLTKTFSRCAYNPYDPTSLSSDLVLSLYQDRTGVIWIGTMGEGLNKYEPGIEAFEHYTHDPQNANSLSLKIVSAIHEDPSGILWIGTYGDGLNKFHHQKKNFTHYRHEPGNVNSISSNVISSIFGGDEGILWVGTYGNGLNAFDLHRESFTRYLYNPHNPNSLSSNSIWFVSGDSRGFLWIGLRNGGLNRFDPRRNSFTRFVHDPENPRSISHNDILSMYEDSRGNLWFGTKKGLDKWIPAADSSGINSFQHFLCPFQEKNPSLDYSIYDIHEDRWGKLWFGSDFGLSQFNPYSGAFKIYNEMDGLVNNVVLGIQEDNEGYLWLSTLNGMSRFNPHTDSFENYDIRDGLQHNQFSYGASLHCRSGYMCFGGINGFNMFLPGKVKDSMHNPYPPPVVITSFKVLSRETPGMKPITVSGELKLSPDDYMFSFEFAALDYRFPEKNKYAYKMEGFDRNWIHTDAKHRVAAYTNLPPGTYTFRIKGSNNSDVWNETGTSLKIIIEPPIWKTWWFRLMAIFLFAFVSYSVIHFSRKYLKLITFWKKENYIGSYRIIEKIGSGGMGTVYKARHVMEDSKIVALKVIREEYVSDELQKKRFLREAAIIDQLDHPHIVRIIERGEHNNLLFMAMEYIEGELLSQRIETVIGKGLPVKEAIDIFGQLLNALVKIHKMGIVHRDLKPSNVMLMEKEGNRNFVKLMDFGLARGQHFSQLTQSGVLIGTINYLSPEYIKGEAFNTAGDIYASGIILYEMLTGRKPFIGTNTHEIMKGILETAPVETRVLRTEIPIQLNRLIMRMMDKNPGSRPAAEEILIKLATF